jgi:GH15 family glucan-1,4-alpha-glucosidase
MPRPIALANGRLYVALDREGRIRDLTYPHVGQLNHLAGHAIRAGVWHNGRFSWLDSDDWNQEQTYIGNTLTGITSYTSVTQDLHIEFEDTVLRDTDALIRRIRVQQLHDKTEDLRLFFTHDLRIAESDIGDTALYHPLSNSMVHYKRQFAFAFGAKFGSNKISQYSTGIKAFGHLEGTWRDAEDGELHMTPIDQGSVDSTFRIDAPLDKKGKAEGFYWICAARSFEDATALATRIQSVDPAELVKADHQAWNHYLTTLFPQSSIVNSESSIPTSEIPPQSKIQNPKSKIAPQYLLLTTQIDHAGGILAATDSDIMQTARAHYSYVWPRDGALVAHTLDRAGDHKRPRNYFEFCKSLLTEQRPFFLQKYGPDGSLGASWHPWVHDDQPETPLQEDETALTVYAIANHIQLTGDTAWLEQNWNTFIAPMADFLVEYRDAKTDLPLPSYDLWEERRGVHTFTVATVIAALKAASKLATQLNDPKAHHYQTAQAEVEAALQRHLYDQERGVFLRGLSNNNGETSYDRVVDASLLQLAILKVIEPTDDRFQRTQALVQEALWVQSRIGGLARYSGDYYFRQSDAYPGNPWVICTLWLAQAHILAGNTQQAKSLLSWCDQRAERTGVLAEQYHPETGAPLSVSPLTWSHAEYIKTCLDLAQIEQIASKD